MLILICAHGHILINVLVLSVGGLVVVGSELLVKHCHQWRIIYLAVYVAVVDDV